MATHAVLARVCHQMHIGQVQEPLPPIAVGHVTTGMIQMDLEMHVMRKYHAKQESGGMAVHSAHVHLVIIAQDTAMLVTIMLLGGHLTLTMIAMSDVHQTKALHQRVPQVQTNVLRHHVRMANI